MELIEELINNVCELLEINIPKISYDTSEFRTKTTRAQCQPESNTICLARENNVNPDYLFSIVHELRHIYQYQTDEQFYLAGYKSADKCSSIEEYNLQIAELDANAFASIVMKDFFSLQPQWNNLPDSVKKAIREREKVLLSTEFYL